MKILYIIVLVILGLVTIWTVGQYFYLKSIEKPNYIVLEQKEGYQVREYDPYVIAYTNMKRGEDSNSFMDVAGYIFGDNTKASLEEPEEIAMTSPVLVNNNENIAMTSPVVFEQIGEEETMSFVMPSKYKKIEDLPKPNNEKVKLKQVESKKWAVLEYSWSRSQKTREKKLEKILELLEKDGVKHTGNFQFAFYDPPTTLPFMLKNEVWVELK